MDEEAKAVEEIAKTTGKAIDAARDAGGFIAKFIAGPLEQGMGIFEDRLRYTRWERQHRLMLRAEEFLRRSGLSSPTRAVPLKLALPLIQGASLEDDDMLQDRWAALLVNAGNADFPFEIRRAYASILEQLTSLDVAVMDAIYALPFAECQHDGVLTALLPSTASMAPKGQNEVLEPSSHVLISLADLTRVGCIRPSSTWGGGESFSRVLPTVSARAFVDACHTPGP
ncbi:Abi-alpha family protein [Variovorax sp. J22G73]|jgi:hypothetical protein|uniref:Abi-alpha family protein n=1 Tax=unclassified Variovorax TaxID=663243 RepID=UPI000E32AFAA|nr:MULTISPECIES: Abi-alpha family protein [unclassified Variovorax]MDM0006201.1 Abi-alpha family protein [Variovorax sp. J22R203]MDM0097776.1 Abi-alpha family protein [Variovorax sp. J22G73]